MNKKWIWFPIAFVVMGAALTTLVMYLWNWLMPAIFGLTLITFWQALGLLVLAKIFFGGGWGKHKEGWKYKRDNHCKEKFRSRWETMSEEDKSKWEKKFCGTKWKNPDAADKSTEA